MSARLVNRKISQKRRLPSKTRHTLTMLKGWDCVTNIFIRACPPELRTCCFMDTMGKRPNHGIILYCCWSFICHPRNTPASITCLVSLARYHLPGVTCLVSLARCHWPGITCLVSLARYHLPGVTGPVSLARYHLPGVTGPVSPAWCHWPGVTGPVSPAWCHWPGVTCLVSLARYHLPGVTCLVSLARYHLPGVTGPVSPAWCHWPGITCLVSLARYPMPGATGPVWSFKPRTASSPITQTKILIQIELVLVFLLNEVAVWGLSARGNLH